MCKRAFLKKIFKTSLTEPSQKEGRGFESPGGQKLQWGVCMFSLCLRVFSVAPASSYICDRWISDPKLTFAVNVSV